MQHVWKSLRFIVMALLVVPKLLEGWEALFSVEYPHNSLTFG
jgi:hypothetical protein